MAVKKAPLNLRPKEKERNKAEKGISSLLFDFNQLVEIKMSGFKRIIQTIISDFFAIK